MQLLTKKRSESFITKAGRFFIVLCLLLSHFSRAQDDDIILFEDEKVAQPAESEPSPSDSLEDNLFVKAHTSIRVGARPLSEVLLSFPALGLVNLTSGLQAYPELYFYGSAYGRIPARLSREPHVDTFADLGDSYLKLQLPQVVLTLGHLILPWQVLRGAALNDRLNPIDYRRGVDFPGDAEGRIPQWGLQIKGSLFGWSAEGICFFWHRPSPGSLVFEEQNGVQIGHYQGGILASRYVLGPTVPSSMQDVSEELTWFLSPTLGFRARRSLGDLDVGLNLVWGYDEVRAVQLSPLFGKAYLDASNGNTVSSAALNLCNNVECLKSQISLTSRRSLSFGGEMSLAMGVVVLKAEAVVTPKVSDSIGKVTILRSNETISSQSLSNVALGFGVDGEYGDWLSGSFELLGNSWIGVPAGFRIHSVEAGEANSLYSHSVHRVALAFAIYGKILSDVLIWNLRGEAGLSQPDIMATIDLRHDFSDSGFYLGAYGNIFHGVQQSPGWFRSSATEIGAVFGYQM